MKNVEEKLYIVIPAYNEEDTIEKVIEEWYSIVEKNGPGSRLLIVNDGSKDKTMEKIWKCEQYYSQLLALDIPNGGHGAAILKGYQYALECGADYIFQTDSDGQTTAADFTRFWENRKECGILIGHRKKREDGFSRLIVTKVLKLVLWLSFGIWTKDANSPYRLMKSDQLAEVIKKIPAGYPLSNVLMTVIYEKYHLGVHYFPIVFRPRQGGKNSLNMGRIIHIGFAAMRDFLKMHL